MFTFNMEDAFDQLFPGVFASTSTDVATQEKSFLSGFVSNEAFPSLNTKKLKSSINESILISRLVVGFLRKHQYLYFRLV